MRVLNRPAMAREVSPDHVRCPIETEGRKPWVTKQRFDPRRERTESQAISRMQNRWRWSILGTLAVVAGSENDGMEMARIVEDVGRPASEPRLDGAAARDVAAVQAGRQGGGVVCDYQIPAAQQGNEIGTEDPAHPPVSVDRKELRLGRALDGPTLRDH